MIVVCTVDKCKFKNSDSMCMNIKVQSDLSRYGATTAKVAGCVCASCSGDCGLIMVGK